MSHQHYIRKCERDHVLDQCRCIGPKVEILVPADECLRCKAEALRFRFEVGQKVVFKNFDSVENLATVVEVRPSDGWLRLDWDDGFEDFYETQWYHPEDFSVKESE